METGHVPKGRRGGELLATSELTLEVASTSCALRVLVTYCVRVTLTFLYRVVHTEKCSRPSCTGRKAIVANRSTHKLSRDSCCCNDKDHGSKKPVPEEVRRSSPVHGLNQCLVNVAEMCPLVYGHHDTKTVSGAMGNQLNHVHTPIGISNGNGCAGRFFHIHPRRPLLF